MSALASTATARVFLVGGLSSLSEGSTHAVDSLTFVELPRLPISANTAAELQAEATRPRVSPVLHLGRQSPILRTSLNNHRRWSRKLLEVTSWCIHGLPPNDSICPIDAATLPCAGVRVRLSGKGGLIRLLPRRLSETRSITVLSEPGACVWLQHGDVLDFGAGVRLHLFAVHVNTSPAVQLAQNASYMWVQPSPDAVSAAPVATWSARFSDWSSIPKFLKTKMLRETAQLVQQAAAQEDAQLQASVRAVADDDSLLNQQQRQQQYECSSTAGTATGGNSPAPPSLDEALRLATDAARRGGRSDRGSEKRQDVCTTAEEDVDEEAATPTSASQQQQQRQRPPPHTASGYMNSPPLLQERGQTRSAPDALGAAVAEARATFHAPPSTAVTQGQTPLRQRPPFRPTGVSLRTSGLNAARYSCVTFSETMDDKLHEALLNLENNGVEVADALVQQQQQQQQLLLRAPAVLLGAMEDDDDLSGPRGVLAENAAQHVSTSPPTQWEEEQEEASRRVAAGGVKRQHQQQRSPQQSRLSATKRGDCVTTPVGSRRGIGNGSGGSATSPTRKHRRTLSAGASLSQPTKKDGEVDDGALAAPQLTRADIKRVRANHPAQEDSQVVFFDY